MKGTRILHSVNLNPGKYAALKEQADLLGQVRTEAWQRFGSLQGVGVNHREIRTDWVKNRDLSPLPAKAWKETLRDALDDIAPYVMESGAFPYKFPLGIVGERMLHSLNHQQPQTHKQMMLD